MNGAKNDVCKAIKVEIKKSNDHTWIAGDVGKLNDTEEFVSEHESNGRIIVILLAISMSLIIVASSFTIICAKLGKSSPIKKPWKIPDTGREYYQVGTLLTLHNAQCSYREGHAYMVKNFTVCLLGPTTKFL